MYFDNAATSYPKPEKVYQACDQVLRAGGNSGRGAHKLSLNAAISQFESRELIAEHLGIADASRLIFTSGCTASINLVLNGLVGAGRIERGDRILVSSFEHNAVMRPLTALSEQLGLEIVVVPPLRSSAHSGCFDALIDLEILKQLLGADSSSRPSLCVFTRASNVTGQILDLVAVADMVRAHNVPLLIDAAQSAGIVGESLDASGVSFWVASGHKGLLGPPGIGLLYVREGEVLEPPYRGGTGSRSESFLMPEAFPDRLEPGSQAVQLAAGLAAGVQFLQSLPEGQATVRAHERELSEQFLRCLAELPASNGWIVSLIGRPGWSGDVDESSQLAQSAALDGFLPTFALQFSARDGKIVTPDQVAQILDQEFDIATRPGLHCALLAHQTLGTVENGLLRVSFGYWNSVEDVRNLVSRIHSIMLLDSLTDSKPRPLC